MPAPCSAYKSKSLSLSGLHDLPTLHRTPVLRRQGAGTRFAFDERSFDSPSSILRLKPPFGIYLRALTRLTLPIRTYRPPGLQTPPSPGVRVGPRTPFRHSPPSAPPPCAQPLVGVSSPTQRSCQWLLSTPPPLHQAPTFCTPIGYKCGTAHHRIGVRAQSSMRRGAHSLGSVL